MRTRLLALAIVTGLGLATAAPSNAATSRIAVHFDVKKGQQPENLALAPDGTAYVTFATARQVAAVSPSGVIKVLATLPAPADDGADVPALGFALTTGIVRTADGTLYFLYASGDPATTGLYRLNPGREPRRIAALPANGLPNGLALDVPAKTFYVTDSALGTISTVPLKGGPARTWSSARELAATGFLGANGIKVRHGAVWATNLDQGTLLRIPITHGRPGPVEVRATGLAGIDDIAFAGRRVVATLNAPNKVVGIDAKGRVATLLTDGLQNPTSVAVRGRTLYVLSAAYLTATDPNLIHATLPRD
ncbi:SMP-30/gluconolactonase/LRE family protein [Herbidospora galbida]|uniref:SMP-30/gluconolactonase/LRE family protein n=1 Tax=Herbidospora galbida TaxID=2575442 RepID=A0A4U3MCR8_9ACTN|nr:SMP-30/gluconolactonase/LRE family protein [Herbidospora galbida]TKK86202.1 SMP-30/gluconolactonase/LRE family protein [Herbidospora galbida]